MTDNGKDKKVLGGCSIFSRNERKGSSLALQCVREEGEGLKNGNIGVM